MEWENNDNGRQRWCVRLVQGGGFGGPLFDGFDNLYVGQPGAIQSFPTTQWTRWRKPVIGMPSTPRFLGGGHLLVATHLGQVLVFDAHRGEVVGTAVDLVDGVDPADATRGLADCAPARQGCPVAAAPAYSAASGTVVLGVWQPGAPTAGLVGLKYHAGQVELVREWTSDAVGDGVLASPVLSADGSTIYVNGRDQRLWALHAADGKPKWSVALAFLAQTPPAVTPQGLIVAGGGPDTRLAAFRDAGDHAEQIWRRDDVMPLATSSLAGTGVGYAVVSGAPGTARDVVTGVRPRQRAHHQQLSAAGGHRVSGRGVGGQRPPGGDRDQRRPGLRFRACLTGQYFSDADRQPGDAGRRPPAGGHRRHHCAAGGARRPVGGDGRVAGPVRHGHRFVRLPAVRRSSLDRPGHGLGLGVGGFAFVAALVFAIWRLTRHRPAFWVPLLGCAVQLALAVGAAAMEWQAGPVS